MLVINAQNVNDALVRALSLLGLGADERSSRNGKVLAFATPVMTVYARPMERVLFSPLRDANPFFHFFEALWMLAGRQDVAFPAQFVQRMRTYSDDGRTIHGAYGNRWRAHFGVDQLQKLIAHLGRQPDTRRAVLQMWCPIHDLAHVSWGKDVPCNTTVYFDARDSRLNMTVCCRSNDLLWGAYGANAVHFSFLLEYVARHLGLEVGVYRQFSNDLHVYTDVLDPQDFNPLINDVLHHNHYVQAELNGVYPRPLLALSESMAEWDDDLRAFFATCDSHRTLMPDFHTDFWRHVVTPLWYAWAARTDFDVAYGYLEKCIAPDWSMAAHAWLRRRAARRPAPLPSAKEAQ